MAALDHRMELLPFAVGDEPGYSLTHWTQAHWSIRVWGSLGPFWADSFSLALSHARIGISRGFARQDGAGRWIADFLLSPAPDAPDPSTLDFLSLASGAANAHDGGPIVLSHYALDGSPDLGPTLYLEARGPDRLGFLGSLLRALALLELSPREMLIATRDGEAFDRFFLKTATGGVPSDDVRRALEERLDAAVRASRAVTVVAPVHVTAVPPA